MTALYIIAFLIACIGIVLALGITPERVGEDMKRFFDKQQTMQDMAKEAQGKKKPNKLMVEMIRIRKVLEETNKENQFSIALALSLVLMVFGCILGIVIDNIFLAPILAVAFAIIPFMYLKGTINMYKKQVDQTLESSLNAITNTYLECNNIRTAVEQCLPAFRQPIYGVFDEFLGKIEDVSPDVVGAIAQMKNQIDNDIFREWCDQLIACQSDSTLKDTLPAIVEKLTAVRLVNSEMRIPLSEARREYYLMVAITVANIPLLYFINQEWYEMLMYSVVGKLVLAVTALVILITSMRTARLTKPIEYKL